MRRSSAVHFGVILAGLGLAGCTALPSEIPDSPGALTSDMASEVMSIASPDLPYLVWQTMLQVQTEDFRTCPEYQGDTSNFTLVGDCSDSAGVSWEGTATDSNDSLTSSLSLKDFGVSGLGGGWQASGQMVVETARGSTSQFITTQLKVVQLDDPAKVYWVDTTGSYTSDSDSGAWYSDEYDGTIGIEAWGTATVASRRTSLAFVNSCDYAAAGFGESDVAGTNSLTLSFHAEGAGGVDTGGDSADTGADSGDTADSGVPAPPPGDTGRDTGDTGGDTADSGVDTAVDSADTAVDTDTTAPAGSCGCATVTLDGVEGETCLTPTRTFTWPFIALGV